MHLPTSMCSSPSTLAAVNQHARPFVPPHPLHLVSLVHISPSVQEHLHSAQMALRACNVQGALPRLQKSRSEEAERQMSSTDHPWCTVINEAEASQHGTTCERHGSSTATRCAAPGIQHGCGPGYTAIRFNIGWAGSDQPSDL